MNACPVLRGHVRPVPQNQLSSNSLFFFFFFFPQCINHKQTMSVAKSSNTAVDAEKVAFIEAALKNGVLLFGEFTLKSGR
jgi:hypothetical protein